MFACTRCACLEEGADEVGEHVDGELDGESGGVEDLMHIQLLLIIIVY